MSSGSQDSHSRHPFLHRVQIGYHHILQRQGLFFFLSNFLPPTQTALPDSFRHRGLRRVFLELDWLDLEVERDQAEHQRLEILHQVVEHPQTLWVSRLGDIDKRSNLGRLEADVLAANLDLQLLSSIFVLLWPLSVVFPVCPISIWLRS